MDQQLWVDKYKPKTLGEVKGHTETQKKAIAWINTYSSSRPERKILLLAGPPGTGKTLLAKTLSIATSIESIEINCSAAREFKELGSLISPFISTSGMEWAKAFIILDEIDGQPKNSAIWEFLEKCLRINTNPIIATCNEVFQLPKDFVTRHCQLLSFRRQYDSTIRGILLEISIKEGFKLTTNELDSIIIKGDIRASISALQIYCMSGFILPQTQRDRNKYSETKDIINKATKIHPSLKVEELLSFVEENGHTKITGIDRYNFYEIVNRVSELVSLYQIPEARKLLGLISYAFTYPQPEPDETSSYEKTISPSYVSKMYLTKSLRKNVTNLSLKMCSDYSLSSVDFFEYIFPVLQFKSINDHSFARRLTNQYSLEPSELALLLNTTTNDPRINKILTPDKTLSTMAIPDKNSQTNIEDYLA